MGTFEVSFQVGDLAGHQFVEVEALVDTGSTYTSIPRNILVNLGVVVQSRRPFRLADESVVEYAIGNAMVRLNGEELAVVVVFADEDSPPLLGMTTLELFGLGIDPVAEQLVPVPGLMK